MITNQLQYINNIQDPSILIIENAILQCYDDFKKFRINNVFEAYKNELEATNFQYIFDRYPVVEHILEKHISKTDNLLSIISNLFSEDILLLDQTHLITEANSKIKNIDISAGDFHNGMSTAIVDLLNHQKIVFKPTQADISESYFCFLDWINKYYSLGEYRYHISYGNHYHWLEFVNHKNCVSSEEIKCYYERAGCMLGVLYVLNAIDFHYENVIARGSTPVFIDHETIIQPKIHSNHQKFFKNFVPKEIEDSVILTMLLPIHDSTFTSMPTGTCGYGYHKQTNIQVFKKEAVDRYTDNWRFVTRFTEESFQKANIPTYNHNTIFPAQYLTEFLVGFEKCYQLFLNHRKFLLNNTQSPIYNFADNNIRFIWRDTNLYAKIFNQMSKPENLISFEHYEKKIDEYLRVAFKNVPDDSKLLFIHKQELAQMLKGDIPFFEVNSSSKDLETEFGIIENFFECSAMENIQRKLKKLSLGDLEFQKMLISKSLLT